MTTKQTKEQGWLDWDMRRKKKSLNISYWSCKVCHFISVESICNQSLVKRKETI